jgi:hypothetical protein
MTKTRTTNSKKRKKTRTGSRVLLGVLLSFAALSVPAWSRGKDKAREAPVPHAVIAGTTFRPPGFALPGARVRITPESPQSGGTRLRAAEAITSPRGEFAFRVPAVPAKWLVRVDYSGYQTQTRTISIGAEERVDLSVLLEPVTGDAKGEKK